MTDRTYGWSLQTKSPDRYPDPIADRSGLPTPGDARRDLADRMTEAVETAWQAWAVGNRNQTGGEAGHAVELIRAWLSRPDRTTGVVQVGLPDGRVLDGEVYQIVDGCIK